MSVFDLEVEPNPNFFANGVLVLNNSKLFDSPIGSVRKIVTSQITYSARAGEGSYATSLTELENAKLIDSLLGSGTKDGYTFTTSAGRDGSTFTTTGTALNHDDDSRNFYTDETGVIRYTKEDRPAWFRDTPLGQ